NEDYIHTSDFVDLVILDLRENQLLLDTKCIVSSSVKCVRVHTSEVAHTRKRKVDQTVNELIHLLASECNLASDRHTFSDLEVSHGVLCSGHNGFLSCDLLHISDRRL